MNLLEQLNAHRHKYTKNEEQLYLQIINNLDRLIKHNITTFSIYLGTSTASLSRFIKKNGFESYNQFRLECLNYQNSQLEDSSISDSTIMDKVITGHNEFNKRFLDSFSQEDINQLALSIHQHKKVRIYGSYRSALIAEKLSIELIALGKFVEMLSSELIVNHLDIINESTDLLIIISESLQSSTVRSIIKNVDDYKMDKVFITMKSHPILDREDVSYLLLPNSQDTLKTNYLDSFVTYSIFINILISTYFINHVRKD